MQQKPRAGSINIFIAYVNEDEEYLKHIEKVLQAIKLQDHNIFWEGSKITAGMEWERENNSHLNNANLILLLVSLDFLVSEHSKGKLVAQAVKRHKTGEAWLIPVIVRPCVWDKTKFAKLQPLPKDGKSIVDWTTIDHALTNIHEGITEAVTYLRSLKTSQPSQPSQPPKPPKPSQSEGNIRQFPQKSS